MANEKANQPKFQIPPLTAEEEDNIILARITNDERPLRRVLKRFHGYASVISPPELTVGAVSENNVEDAREAFLVELSSYELSLKKSAMVCEAEARQVEEYRRERQRIEQEHEVLQAQIDELKMALEHAQMLRRRKIEYDQLTEKVNTLPPREELQQEISALESDMAAIRSEHEVQNRTLQLQKAALDGVVSDLLSIRLIGKDKDATSIPNSPDITPALDLPESATEPITETQSQVISELDVKDDTENIENGTSDKGKEEGAEDDIEMGEVEEEPRDKAKKKAREEELEEGEASDESSELSEPPDD